ncbi:MAG TPA: phospho-N-acetylmuramoyl-pentapeptide-transferase [bacterium]|nr:phospho-N-acetylmuramoyl-pentapeptide-transferase [bacterium]
MPASFQPQLGFEAHFLKSIGPIELTSSTIFALGLLLGSFMLSMLWAPSLIGPLRRISRQRISKGERPTLYSLHSGKQGTPSMGGVLFVITTLALSLISLFPLPAYLVILLGGFLAISIVGVTDDYLVSWGRKYLGLTAWHKFVLQCIVAGVLAMQLYLRLGFTDLYLPFFGYLHNTWLVVPGMIGVLVCTMNAVNFTDGLDGLAGGVSLFSLGAYLIIALLQGQAGLAAVLAILIGSLLAFLWFNIFPARFFMGDVGSLSLGLMLGMAAVLTEQIFLLPIIGLVFVLEAISVILQMIWRKAFKKKLFAIAPFHHHFEAKGWPETKVSQRFWLVSFLASLTGLFIYMLDMHVI